MGSSDGFVVAVAGLREPAATGRAFDHGSVVAVGREHALRAHAVRVADHAEQRFLAALAVDDPVGIEDLVPAVLGVRLREHHQFDVGRVAPQLVPERVDQVVDFVLGEREAEFGIGALERRPALREHRHRSERLGCVMGKERRRGLDGIDDAFGHAVVDDGGDRCTLRRGQGRVGCDVVRHAALDAGDLAQSADVRDVRRLRRPRRHRAEARQDQQQLALGRVRVRGGPVAQQGLDDSVVGVRQRGRDVDEMQVAGVDGGDARDMLADGGEDLVEPEIRERGSAAEGEHERGRPPDKREPQMIPDRVATGQRAADVKPRRYSIFRGCRARRGACRPGTETARRWCRHRPLRPSPSRTCAPRRCG